ncbi:hypothetical protein PIB30_075906 [Stylosanthes scabra]|uniref:Uncharacterized protein n=1 Tax=Stylosanthes scabra TaxID=79078 RepID=A0ABU6TQT3_9FABA|nr:hypothetical protein [Stylosanthes scabra]
MLECSRLKLGKQTRLVNLGPFVFWICHVWNLGKPSPNVTWPYVGEALVTLGEVTFGALARPKLSKRDMISSLVKSVLISSSSIIAWSFNPRGIDTPLHCGILLDTIWYTCQDLGFANPSIMDLDGICTEDQSFEKNSEVEDNMALNQNYYKYVMADIDEDEGNMAAATYQFYYSN